MAAVVCALAAALLLAPAPAFARVEHLPAASFGAEGSGEGQFATPSGVAVNGDTNLSDPAAGDVYVVDKGNNRVERFSSGGTTFLGEFEAPTGGFQTPEGIAVDSSGNPLDPSAGDVYVVNTGHDAIDKFDAEGHFIGTLTEAPAGAPFGELEGVSVDASGSLWVYQSSREIDRLDDSVANQYAGPTPPLESPFSPTPGSGFAVDSADNLYLIRGNRLVAKTSSTATALIKDVSETPQEPPGQRQAAAIAVDLSNDELYMDNEGSVGVYSTSGSSSTLLERFGSGTLPEGLPEGNGMAVDAAHGAAYVSDPVADVVYVFDEVTVPDVVTGEATGLETEGAATLNGTVNPDGLEVTSCEFEYGTETSYGLTAPCGSPPGSGATSVAVSADIAGLTPGATYHFRLVAANAEGSNPGTDRTFTAYAPPKIDSESVVGVTADSATLAAELNPGGPDTTYRFEFGPTTAYGRTLPLAEAHTGAGVSDVAVSVRAQGLDPGAIYHYRVVASNVIMKSVAGEDRTFTTRPAAVAAGLPDGRAWELVSPADKLGAAIEALTAEGGAIQASASGGALAYVANAPIEPEPEGNPAKELTQVLAARGSSGWISHDIATPHETATGVEAGNPSEYKLFSPDLSSGVIEQIGNDETPLPLRPPEAEKPEKTIYVRDNSSASYEPLVSAGNVPPGTEFGGRLAFTSATPDLSHVVLSSEAALTAPPIVQQLSLYEWAAGQLQLASVLPNGEPAPLPALGLNSHDVRHAISDDGSRVVFSAEGHLFERDMSTHETVQLDANQGGPPPPLELHAPQFQTASSDGSRVLFTDAERLTADSTAKSEFPPAGDLYLYNTAGDKLIDLTVDHNGGESAEVQGAVLGANEGGSQVYFVARGVLTNVKNHAHEEALPGRENLYVVHTDGDTTDEPTFIATLSSDDMPDWENEEDSADLAHLTARVSPNGRFLAFMSDRPLTGYDNTDANSGHADEEVFLYDAGSNLPVCASCNPDGARPEGVFDPGGFPGLLVDRPGAWEGRWLAASIPGWTLIDGAHALHQSRYLSNDGRLFFNSPDALSSEDINGVEDVYEYEPGELGSCHEAGGCVALLSSGKSPEESAFLDASASGNDAFLLTAARLTSPPDIDGSLDVYDAHLCSGESPCPPASSSSPAPCGSGEACKAAPSSQPTFQTPPTSTFAGAGNLAAPAPTPKHHPLTRAQKLAKALKACRKSKQRRRRAACEARARKQYGAHKAKVRKGSSAKHRKAKRGGRS